MKIMLDTINLTFIDYFDHEKVKQSFKELPTYEYFPKIQKLYEYFKWDKKDFTLKKMSQNFYKLYDDKYYVEIKNYTANGEKSVAEKKVILLQLKGQFFLEKTYQELQNIITELKKLDIKISKIEIAIDLQEEYVFETMTKVLKYRNQFIKLSGKETQYHLNFTNKNYESLSVSNSVMIIKVYNKFVQINLEKNQKKVEQYYQKTGFKRDKNITRLELSLKRSSSIDQSLIDEILNKTEIEFNKSLLNEILEKIEVLKPSKLKAVIKDLKKYSSDK